MLIIRPPQTAQEWEHYYQLRFTILREPWGQLKGSEVLQDEDQADHVMVIDSETKQVVGVARMQTNTPTQGQVRCVAVASQMQGRGVGKLLMNYLEELAQQKGIQEIILDARENAVKFYISIGYEIFDDSYLLFGQIQHWKMRKQINAAS
ncbi:MAG: GNAT family N-acetyltransferase [Arcicella sp.]|nr:GNAT family N-acetyltransferase [Arcicella sp.]